MCQPLSLSERRFAHTHERRLSLSLSFSLRHTLSSRAVHTCFLSRVLYIVWVYVSVWRETQASSPLFPFLLVHFHLVVFMTVPRAIFWLLNPLLEEILTFTTHTHTNTHKHTYIYRSVDIFEALLDRISSLISSFHACVLPLLVRLVLLVVDRMCTAISPCSRYGWILRNSTLSLLLDFE